LCAPLAGGILGSVAENNAILSEAEKGRILYHLGYGIVNIADIMSLGVPAISQPLYLAMSLVNRIPVSRIHLVRELLANMDSINEQMIDARKRYKAKSLGEITLNPDETKMLRDDYAWWANRLADITTAPLNPYSQAFSGGRRPIVVPVRQV